MTLHLNRRDFLSTFAVGGGAAFLAACTPAPTGSPAGAILGSPAPKAPGWDELLAAARREGTVVIYGPTSEGLRTVVTEEFEKAIPGIKVDGVFAGGNEPVTRIMTERTAGRYIADCLITGTTPAVVTLKSADAVAPLKPYLMLPEVLDEKAWLQNRLWWADSAEPYTTLMFQGLLITPVYINKNLVRANEITSYWDLLDPKWKGKIISNDIRQGGPGGVPARFIYKHADLGPNFLERLYSEQDITLSLDQRQMVDWLAQGRYAIALFIAETEAKVAMDQGLPVDAVPVEQFKERGPIGPGNGSIAVIDKAPHPNAVKVLVNWLLSREGQDTWQRVTQYPSLRTDIPKTGLLDIYTPKPGFDYVDAGTEEYSRITGTIFTELITAALEKAGRP